MSIEGKGLSHQIIDNVKRKRRPHQVSQNLVKPEHAGLSESVPRRGTVEQRLAAPIYKCRSKG
jgi:hypothetical protein